MGEACKEKCKIYDAAHILGGTMKEEIHLRRITEQDFLQLAELQKKYKEAIGETIPDDTELLELKNAIQRNLIEFYGVETEEKLVAMCSVCKTFSTFLYQTAGVFEDFYILPDYRHKGLAKQLAAFAWTNSGVSSMTVGCAACDLEMYQAIGFTLPLGNLLAYENCK